MSSPRKDKAIPVNKSSTSIPPVKPIDEKTPDMEQLKQAFLTANNHQQKNKSHLLSTPTSKEPSISTPTSVSKQSISLSKNEPASPKPLSEEEKQKLSEKDKVKKELAEQAEKKTREKKSRHQKYARKKDKSF